MSTRDKAIESCRNMGGRLPKLNEPSKMHMVKRLLEKAGGLDIGMWLGLSDSTTEGTWLWNDGNQTRNYTQWLPGEPKIGPAGELADCAIFKKVGNNTGWENVACSSPYEAFIICEKGMVE